MMSRITEKAAFLMSLADVLIPAHREMPAFSAVCGPPDIERCLSFRPDAEAAFDRVLSAQRTDLDARATVVELAVDDPDAFAAFGLIVVSAYYMSPRVRDLIGYPGQESLPIRPGEAESDLLGGLLQQVIDRGRRYVPTPTA